MSPWHATSLALTKADFHESHAATALASRKLVTLSWMIQVYRCILVYGKGVYVNKKSTPTSTVGQSASSLPRSSIAASQSPSSLAASGCRRKKEGTRGGKWTEDIADTKGLLRTDRRRQLEKLKISAGSDGKRGARWERSADPEERQTSTEQPEIRRADVP